MKAEQMAKAKHSGFWISPFSGDELKSGEERIRLLLHEKGLYGIGSRTPGRKSIRPGDWVCFYLSGSGVVAHALVASAPEFRPDLVSPFYPIVFRVTKTELYTNGPVILDERRRAKLDAFRMRNSTENWGWFVTGTHSITKHDFEFLTAHASKTKGLGD